MFVLGLTTLGCAGAVPAQAADPAPPGKGPLGGVPAAAGHVIQGVDWAAKKCATTLGRRDNCVLSQSLEGTTQPRDRLRGR
ncbi:hypothetical protein ACIRF8_35220 [Streptomyces sp. NPDC102406]|uniref:hypothetical protein n=1 Tax=Streptomyces sp. NPDC102406 TaxID=3366171 RepID=UPI00382F51E1